MISKYILLITLLNEPVKGFNLFLSNANNCIDYLLFVCTQLNVLKYCYLTLTILSNNINSCKRPNSSISNNSI